MKYEVIRDCVIVGSRHKVGDIVEVAENVAKDLMGIGRIVPADESKLEDRSVGLKADKPRTRKKKFEPVIAEEAEAGEE